MAAVFDRRECSAPYLLSEGERLRDLLLLLFGDLLLDRDRDLLLFLRRLNM